MEASGRPSTAQTVLLATSSALTAVLYTIYKRKASHVTRLREAKKLPLNPDLQTILAKAPGKCVPYAVIEGVVRSVKETLNSQFVDNCKGVIERLTLKEKKMYLLRKKQRKERSLLDEYRKLQSRRIQELNLAEDDVSPSMCTVCLSNERSCVFLECGHVCTCEECYKALPIPKKCPICRARIDRIVPLYKS